MAIDTTTAYVLNARLGWRSLDPAPAAGASETPAAATPAHATGASDAGDYGIRLRTRDGDQPLSLLSPDGSLGGLLLPRGFAFDRQHRLCLLVDDPAGWRVRRFDPGIGGFRTLPRLGGAGADAAEAPQSMAIVGSVLCLCDPLSNAVLRYDLERFRPLAPLLHGSSLWSPIDLVSASGELYVLSAEGRIHCWDPAGSDRLQETARRTGGPPWSRLAIDRRGQFHVLVAAERGSAPAFLGRFAPRGRAPAPHRPAALAPTAVATFAEDHRAYDSNTVRSLFPPPWIRLWLAAGQSASQGRFFLPAALAAPCIRFPIPLAPPEDPLSLYRAAYLAETEATASDDDAGTDHAGVPTAQALLFGRDGMPAAAPDPLERPAPAYDEEGTWHSAALDSGLYDCQWDKITIEFARLPAGCAVEVSTFSADVPTAPALLGVGVTAALQRERNYLWATNYTIRADRQSDTAPGSRTDLLVQSRPGRYLQLRLRLVSPGQETPVIRSVRVAYPRRSYLELLPPVFASDAQSRWFLERYLSIFQAGWAELQTTVRSIDRYFMPSSVPGGAHLRYLARWLAVPLQTAIDKDGERRLLRAAVRTYPRRGTPWAVGEMLRACLANLTRGLSSAVPGYPVVVEGFRQRHRVVLDQEASGGLSGGATLWGASVTDRLQVGVHARVGQSRLLRPGSDRSDYLARHANAVSIYAPACWLRDSTTFRLFSMAAANECPAQTDITIVPVEADLRVGLQSTVGIDTIIGSYPVAATAADGETPPPPGPTDLSYGPILSVDPPPPGVRGQPRLPDGEGKRERSNG